MKRTTLKMKNVQKPLWIRKEMGRGKTRRTIFYDKCKKVPDAVVGEEIASREVCSSLTLDINIL